MKKVIFTISILIFTSYMYSAVVLNGLPIVFPDHDDIENDTITGASNYLQSKVYSDMILLEYEKSNFSLISEYTEKAITELKLSINVLSSVIKNYENREYKNEYLQKFERYDYDSYININNLNTEVASTVKTFLQKCDIVGVYKKHINNMNNILTVLNTIKDQEIPSYDTIRKLLRLYSETSLFVVYSTSMGNDVINN